MLNRADYPNKELIYYTIVLIIILCSSFLIFFPQINTGHGQDMDEKLDMGQTEQMDLIPESRQDLKFGNATDQSKIKVLPYENIDKGVRMEYPSDWNVTESEYYDYITFTHMGDFRISSIHSSPDENASLAQIFNQTISDYNDTDSLLGHPNFTLLGSSSNSSNSDWFQQQLPSAMLNYSYIDNYNYDIKNNTEIITIYNDKVYSILFSANELAYEEDLSDVKQMIKSLKIFSMIPYENIDAGVRMEYPSDWKNVTGNFSSKAMIELEPPVERQSEEHTQAHVSLNKYSVPRGNDSLNEYVEFLKNLYNNQFTDFSVDDTDILNVTLGGNPAYKLDYSYTGKDDKIDYKARNIGTIVNSKVYEIEYVAPGNNYTNSLPTVQNMIDSFNIVELLPYENLDKRVRIQYPSDWTKEIKDDDWSVTFRFPDNPIGQLKLYIYPKSEKDLDAEIAVPEPPKGLKKTSPANDTSLLDNNGRNLMYNYTDKQYGFIKGLRIATQKNDTTYLVIYVGPKSTFDGYLPTAQKMIESIKIFDLNFYENIPNQIQIKYPSTWDIQTANNTLTLMPSAHLSPRDNLTIRSLNSTDLLNSVIYTNNTYTKKLGFEYIGKSNRTIQTTLGNSSNATELLYRKNGDDFNLTATVATEILAQYNDKIYSISFLSKENRYNRYSTTDLPEYVNDTINNFRLIEFADYTQDELNSTKQRLIPEIEFPRSWALQPNAVGFKITSPAENEFDKFNETLFLSIQSADPGTNIERVVSNYINSYKGNVSNFQLIYSKETTLFSNSAHKVVYTYKEEYCQCDIKGMSVFTIINNKEYIFEYFAELDKFSTYLPTIQAIINSTKILEKMLKYTTNKSGLPLNGGPVDLAINPVTNRIYIAIPEANQIQVINGATDHVIKNITIGSDPNTVALNSDTNKIYVASPETDMIYVIDGLTNNMTHQIQAGPLVADMAVDTDEFGGFSTLIFVANAGNDSVSVIDDVKGRVVSNIQTSEGPFGIGIDTIKNRAYITTDSGIDIIDYTTNVDQRSVKATLYGHLDVGDTPLGIVVNPDTSRAYITNSLNNTVSVIDTITNKPLYEIEVGLFPNAIAFNPVNKTLYVSNTGDNTVSLIDSTTDKKMKDIEIDSQGADIAVNPKTNIIYIANLESKTLSTVNGTVNKIESALIFHIYPANAGYIECNQTMPLNSYKKMPLNSYQRIIKDTKCVAIANSGFVFSSWSGRPPSTNSTGIPENKTILDALSTIIFGSFSKSHENSFNVTHYGTYTANFFSFPPIIQAVSPFLSIGTLIFVIVLASIKPIFTTKRKITEGDKKSEEASQTITILAKVHKGDIAKKEKQGEKGKERDKILSIGEILTIDATVIIGVLIFLTFSEGFEASQQYQINIITASIVFPFAISAIVGVTRNEEFATRLMIAGFINLMISIMLIAMMKIPHGS